MFAVHVDDFCHDGAVAEDVKVTDGGAGGRGGPILTARELEIVVLVVDGLSNREIGDRLAISARTVQSHLAATMRKLRATSRTQVAVAALRAGLVAIDGLSLGGVVDGRLGDGAADGPAAGNALAGVARGVGSGGDASPGGGVPVSRRAYQLKVRAAPGVGPDGAAGS